MKHNFTYSFIAVAMAVILAFSGQISMLAPGAVSISEKSVGSESDMTVSTVQLTDSTDDTTDISAQTVSLSSDSSIADVVVSDNNYKSEETIPGGSSAVKPEDVLPDIEESEDIDTDINEERDGVTIIPVKINNSIRDSLSSVISENIYTFSVDERGVIIYAFNHIDSQVRDCLWYITLYEEYSPDGMGKTSDYRELERVTYSSVGTACQSASIGVAPGNYRISVECISGFTGDRYELAIGFAQADNYELEPNNSKSRYTELSLDVTLNGSAGTYGSDENDIDWYMFEVTETGYAVLYFEHEADTTASSSTNIAWRVRLTDLQGNEYFYTTSGMDKTMINSGVMGLKPGYYFVTVYSHVFSGVTYALNVSFTKDSAIEREFNDSAETATPINVNTETVGSLTARNDAADRDYYSFTMENDGFVIIDFIHEALSEAKDGWHITVMSENGDIAYSSVSDWSQNVHQSPNIGLTAGKYYVLIDSDNIYHSNIIYRLILLTVQDGTWESEPNNMPSSADVISVGSVVNGTLIETGIDYDMDYYSLQVDKSGTLQVSFNHIRSDEADKEGWIISVIDKDGNVISSATSDWNSEEITFTANLEAGTYFILVETGLFFNSDRYMLTAVFG